MELIPFSDEPKDPRAVSLKAQLDDLEKAYNGHPNKLATVDEALRVQVLIESILASN